MVCRNWESNFFMLGPRQLLPNITL
ncbi:hypothetical protein BWO94_04660 [Staphylococcus aureus]|nr:hypothetical protein BRL61_11200 [Staphylococcus aureus]AVU15197.1 hypothetical protein AB477_11480 [Staphylococcus aureus]MCL9699350.1 hypothetical protein [Staphylococcus aureus]OOC92838.1 hypothetical protein BWO94_04660 [Staphylococcus aureus]OSC60504.1 hypothetical protein B8A08_02060 [Staphylococcus aureus]